MAHHNDQQHKVTVGMWKECWNTPNGVFHNPDLNELLIKYHDKMLTRPDVCGEIDGIWDSGSLNTMDVEDRDKYIHRIRSLMGKGCVNLTEFVNFDKSIVDITWSMTKEELEREFGEGFKVEDITQMDAPKRLKDQGCDSLTLFAITKT
uniref:Uncharacterized protein LOC111132977 isoform X3 n=1 Tax=Crassostrea virginica TaxID=6565 RepID=A0A8B8E7Q7_CRAVI|nr:uncharacterized protein LOC111132977 isoform X3 [Crassostrea virginica]